MQLTILFRHLGSVAIAGIVALGMAIGATPAAAAGHEPAANMALSTQAVVDATSITDTFTFKNVGGAAAQDVKITVPFDSVAVKLLSVQFSRPDAFVTDTATNEFTASLGDIGRNSQDLQVTAAFAKLPGYTATNPLITPITISYHDGHHSYRSTASTELVPATWTSPQPMNVAAGAQLPVSSGIFAPDEQIAFWYNTPDGQALPLYVYDRHLTTVAQHRDLLANGAKISVANDSYLPADAQGAFSIPLSTGQLPRGEYTLVAYGMNSSATAVIAFTIQ